MSKKPRLSFWQIWNMSFGFLGIQFGFGLQNANVSRIFQTLGADIDSIPILWIAAPVTGLLIQPIVGHMSDKTWTRLGRRRPFFLVGAILASAALIMMPNSPMLWVAAGMLWIMDASINISMEPFRAFVGDNLPSDQRTLGFTMQSFFIGIGAFIASWLPYVMANWFDIPNKAPEGVIPQTVKLSFYIGGAVFLLTVLWTVFTSKEYSPDELKEFENGSAESESIYKTPVERAFLYLRRGIIWTFAGLLILFSVIYFDLKKELFVLAGGILLYGILQFICWQMVRKNKTDNGLVSIITDLYRMPRTMRQLAFVQFFSWFALFSMWIYTTAAITSHLYNATDTTSEAYNTGANWVGGMFGWYNLFAAVFSLAVLPWLAKLTNRKITHMIALTAGGLGLLSLYFITTPQQMIFSMIGVGLAWAGILSMPYAILTGALPQDKMGVYMGIFNFFIVIPQILAAVILGFMVKDLFQSQAIYALVTAGISLFIAAVVVLFVEDKDYVKVKKSEIK
jgi:maltose/moltooligosaccharide transporter